MASIPEVGRQSAHVLLDAIAAYEAGADDTLNLQAMNLALQRLDDIGAIDVRIRDDAPPTVDVSPLVGGAAVSLNWLISRLASARAATEQEVISDLRDFLDR